MYATEGTDAELAALGLTREDIAADSIVEVWPDNWEAVMTFIALSTQWRIGMNGPTGLDYSALHPVFRMKGIPRTEWNEAFEAIRIMEHEALLIMNRES